MHQIAMIIMIMTIGCEYEHTLSSATAVPAE